MYDVDGNGVIDQDEMMKIVQAIYDMLGAGAVKPQDTAEERSKNIFARYLFNIFFQICTFIKVNNVTLILFRMDENNDGTLTEEEFLKGCIQDDELSKMLAPNVSN